MRNRNIFNCPFVVQIILGILENVQLWCTLFYFQIRMWLSTQFGDSVHECNKHSVIWIIPKYFRAQYSSKFVKLCQAPRTSKILLKILKSNRRIIATITYLSRFYSTINTFLLAINLVAPVVAFLPCCDWIMLRVCRYRSVDTMVSVQQSLLQLTNPCHPWH